MTCTGLSILIAIESMRESCFSLQVTHILISRTRREEEIRRAYDKADTEDILRDAKDAPRRLKDSRKGKGSPTREPNAQTRQCGMFSGDGTDAQDDEMSKATNILGPTSESIDIPMQDLTNQGEDSTLAPKFLPPTRTWTNISAGTTTTLVAPSGGNVSIKAIKAFSRKPTSRTIVSQWLRSNYGSESSRKRKRPSANIGVEVPVGQAGLGGSLVGSMNFLLSPEQEKVTEVAFSADEDMPPIVIDASRSDQQAARVLKRRKVETPLQTLDGIYSSPLP